MIVSFGSTATEDIYDGFSTKQARSIPESVWAVAHRKLDMLNAAHALVDLRIPPGNQLEKLVGDYEGHHSIRINDQYRLVFRWVEGHAYDVTITDYH
jgi:proteic killer suppression protein